MPNQALPIIGMMSGTSVDGIDATIVISDGITLTRTGIADGHEYSPATRDAIFQAMEIANTTIQQGKALNYADFATLNKKIAEAHAGLAQKLIARYGKPVALIGFHGQTILHRPRPQPGLSLQLGDAELLARLTGVRVAHQFRANDLAHGGEGAPLAPIYHLALAKQHNIAPPFAIANIGGIANITLVADGKNEDTSMPMPMLAFDTGAGNVMLDVWMQRHAQKPFDKDGAVAATGTADADYITAVLSQPWFATPPPKSLDREEAKMLCLADRLLGLPFADGMASLTEITALTIIAALGFASQQPNALIITGGGARNRHLLRRLKAHAPSQTSVVAIDALGVDSRFIEAEMMALLAGRCVAGLAITFPSTTGVAKPQPGGVVANP